MRLSMRWMQKPARRAMRTLSSVDPESTTSTWAGAVACARIATAARCHTLPPLSTGITTAVLGERSVLNASQPRHTRRSMSALPLYPKRSAMHVGALLVPTWHGSPGREVLAQLRSRSRQYRTGLPRPRRRRPLPEVTPDSRRSPACHTPSLPAEGVQNLHKPKGKRIRWHRCIALVELRPVHNRSDAPV